MKQTFINLALFTMLVCALMSSCTANVENVLQEPNEEITSVEQEEAILKSLKFKPITETSLRSGVSLGIVSITFGRGSECKPGFGICDAVWFPGWSEWFDDVFGNSKSSSNSASAVLTTSENGREYIVLELAEETNIAPKHLTLNVEKSIEMPNSGENAFEKGYMIEQGRYEFSEQQGEYGGYAIPVK